MPPRDGILYISKEWRYHQSALNAAWRYRYVGGGQQRLLSNVHVSSAGNRILGRSETCVTCGVSPR